MHDMHGSDDWSGVLSQQVRTMVVARVTTRPCDEHGKPGPHSVDCCRLAFGEWYNGGLPGSLQCTRTNHVAYAAIGNACKHRNDLMGVEVGSVRSMSVAALLLVCVRVPCAHIRAA